MTDAADDELWTIEKVRKLVPYTRQHIRRLEVEGKFPRRLQIGARRVGWWKSEIQDWLKQRPRGPLPTVPDDDE